MFWHTIINDKIESIKYHTISQRYRHLRKSFFSELFDCGSKFECFINFFFQSPLKTCSKNVIVQRITPRPKMGRRKHESDIIFFKNLMTQEKKEINLMLNIDIHDGVLH